jgi:hypothetical protein
MFVARHDPFVVHAIDGDQLRCDPWAMVTVRVFHCQWNSMMNQFPDSRMPWGYVGIVGPVRTSLRAVTLL